ncbi:hypothetical protein QJS04_geneDACA005096 [Acorus gramineus]|uniref:Uncharacterized protein n=1 Tax=Acorus gramineus TaxID=55184 RepID=A0AAV9AVT9_ACOGR|nr:hypothetical protein QJS04_geneDACA005096 [Acorus gramineus]
MSPLKIMALAVFLCTSVLIQGFSASAIANPADSAEEMQEDEAEEVESSLERQIGQKGRRPGPEMAGDEEVGTVDDGVAFEPNVGGVRITVEASQLQSLQTLAF